MLNMSNAVKVKVTSIVNPYEFYFRFLDEKTENTRTKVSDIQKKVERLRFNKVKPQNVQIGKIYGSFHERWGKYPRVKVMERLRDGRHLVFLIDHGFTRCMDTIIDIPQELQTIQLGHIQRGTLQIECNMDHAIEDFLRRLDSSDREFHLVQLHMQGAVHVCDLLVIDRNERYSLTEKLVSMGCRHKRLSFSENYSNLGNQEALATSYNHPRQRVEIYQNATAIIDSLPKNLFLYGPNLQPPWRTLNDLQFHNFFKERNRSKFQSMTHIESYIWPLLTASQNAIVISKNQDHFSYLAPLVNKIVTNKDHRAQPDIMGPIAIIFVSCSSKVEEIARLCSDHASNLSIIRAAGICDELKYSLIAGCDLLIATPPAFERLIRNIAINIIDPRRLKHVVYNNFHQLIFKFELHINRSLKQSLNFSPQPQFIVTANSLTSALKCRLISHLPPASTVLCVDDNHFEAASYAGMNLSMQFVPKRDDLHEILLNDSINHERKTIIVASDDNICRHLEKQLSAAGFKLVNGCHDVSAVKQWDVKDSVDSVLIISDNVISDVDIKSARQLIHYDLPPMMDRYSRRFQVFHNGIINKLNAQTNSLSTKIFLHNENVKQFLYLMDFASQNLSNSFKDILEKIKTTCENAKCKENVAVCNTLLQYGECKKVSCPARHVLAADRDSPLSHLPKSQSLVKFDLISVQNPTSFIIKIKEQFDNNKWVSRDEAHKVIQQRLNEMQAICQKREIPLTMNEGVVGGIYAKFLDDKGIWVRVRIVQRILPQLVSIYLIDNGVTMKSYENKLFELPEEYNRMDPLVCKLQAVDLIPLDMEDQYDSSHTNDLQKMIKKVDKKAFFMCKVEAVLFDTIFTKSFDSRGQLRSFKFNLRTAHQKMRISDVDDSASENLLKLISTIVSEKPVAEKPKKTQSLMKLRDVHGAKLPSVTCKKLVCGKTYAIKMSHYISPHSFLVILDNDENLTLKNGLKSIEEKNANDQLGAFVVGTVCLYKKEKVYRGVILSMRANDECEILMVDHGYVKICNKEDLFEIPTECLSLQFQAVHCSMMGIRPKYNMKMWPKMQRDAVRGLMNESPLDMLVVNCDAKQQQCTFSSLSCYQVLIFNRSTDDRLDKIAVERKIADEDESVHDLKLEMNSRVDDSDCEEDINNPEENNLKDDLLSVHVGKEFESLLKIEPHFERFLSSDSASTTSSSALTEAMSTSESPSPSSLVYMYKPTHIEWRQNEHMLYLLITARDSIDYFLSITPSSMDVIVQYPERKCERSLLIPFGLLNVKLCSHEFTGSTIIVRLVKKRASIWPHLTSDQEKSHFIQFSNEKVPLNRVIIGDIGADDEKHEARPAGDSDIESDSEKEFKDISSDEY